MCSKRWHRSRIDNYIASRGGIDWVLNGAPPLIKLYVWARIKKADMRNIIPCVYEFITKDLKGGDKPEKEDSCDVHGFRVVKRVSRNLYMESVPEQSGITTFIRKSSRELH